MGGLGVVYIGVAVEARCFGCLCGQLCVVACVRPLKKACSLHLFYMVGLEVDDEVTVTSIQGARREASNKGQVEVTLGLVSGRDQKRQRQA